MEKSGICNATGSSSINPGFSANVVNVVYVCNSIIIATLYSYAGIHSFIVVSKMHSDKTIVIIFFL